MNGLPQGEQRQAKRAKTLKLPCAEVRIYVRNQQVAGSSPASSSTKPRVSAEIRGFVRQKRSKTFRSDITEKTHEFRPPALA